jgi:inhibitor of KinA
MRWRHYGPNAVMLKFADASGDEAFARSRALAAALERNPPPGLIEYVPAFTTMLLEFAARVPDHISEFVDELERASGIEVASGRIQEISVIYNGPDLQRVAEMHKLTTGEVIELHSAPIYKVYMLGFAPGFPYLGDLDSRLHTPRLASPRARVAAGSVAIGGSHTGIYSVDTPGGWNIIGSTNVKLFDPAQKEMFLLRAGDRVRFVPERS